MTGLPLQIMPFGSLATAGLYQVRNTRLGHIVRSLTLNALELSGHAHLGQIVPPGLTRGAAEVGDPIEHEVKKQVDLYLLDQVVRLLRPFYPELHDLLILHLLNPALGTVMMGGLVSALE